MGEYKQGSSKATKQPVREDYITSQFHESVKLNNRMYRPKKISFYPIDAKAMNSSTSKGKSSRKFVLNKAVTVSEN